MSTCDNCGKPVQEADEILCSKCKPKSKSAPATTSLFNQNIQAAAELIAEIDPALSRAFIAQPFNRGAMITAFHRSLSECYLAPLADKICMYLRGAIDTTRSA